MNSHHFQIGLFPPQKPPPKSHEVNWRPTRDAVTQARVVSWPIPQQRHRKKQPQQENVSSKWWDLCIVIILPEKKHEKSLPIRRRLFFSLPRVRKWNISGDLQIGLACLGTSDSNTSKGRPKTQSLGGLEPLEVLWNAQQNTGLPKPTCTGTFKSRPQHHS